MKIIVSDVILLLRCLGDRPNISISSLSKHTGFSEHKIRQLFKASKSLGIEVINCSQRGYRIPYVLKWLSESELINNLGEKSKLFDIEVVSHTGSTNQDLLKLARMEGRTGTVRAAEYQTEGRGRRGRKWTGNLGGALMFSMIWNFRDEVKDLAGLSLTVGVAIIRVMRSMGLQDVQLKWPNDIVCQRGKLGGVLIELVRGEFSKYSAVIGIGINVLLSDEIKNSVEQEVVDLNEMGSNVDRNILLADLLIELQAVLAHFSKYGFRSFKNEWENFHMYQNKKVRILETDFPREGVVLGVTDEGALRVQFPSGEDCFYGNEISIRSMEN